MLQSSKNTEKLINDPQNNNQNIKNNLSSFLNPSIYFLINLLFIYQLIVYIQNHSHLGGLVLWDTAFLLIVNADPRYPFLSWLFGDCSKEEILTRIGRESVPLLQIIGVVVFQALLFVNFTHAIEAIFCDDSTSLYSQQFITMVVINIIFKLILFSSKFSIKDLSKINKLTIHFASSIIMLILFYFNWLFTYKDNELISKWDRYFGALFCLLMSVATLKIFRKNLPFLLCDSPEGIDANELKDEIEKEFKQIECRQLHIYRKWPNKTSFEAFVHIQIIDCSFMRGNEAKIKTEAKVENEVVMENEAKSEVEAKREIEAKSETEAKMETKAKVEAGSELEAEAKSETEAKMETKAKVEAGSEREAEAKSETEAKMETEAEAKVETKSHCEAKYKTKANFQTEAEIAERNKENHVLKIMSSLTEFLYKRGALKVNIQPLINSNIL
uniref:Uncharacterized protein n=1 Tax=Meloidogyne enterolobii TaxID=390850 RepID=A0A6V7WCZ4_MELEN|nr:unnamed protein product [Meloidogyne enterolobii]